MKAGILVVVLIAMLVSAPAFGNAPNQEKDFDDWHFYIAPYFFFSSLSGYAVVTSPMGEAVELPLAMDFKSLAENLDWGLAGLLTAKKARWSFGLDLCHIELSKDQTMVLPGPMETEVMFSNKVKMDEHELFVGYQFNEGFPASDFIFGARYVNFDICTDVTAGPEEMNLSIGESFFVPFIGLRYYGPLYEDSKWSPFIRGDVGGLTTSGKLNWRFNFGIAWLFAKHFDLSLQYRWKQDNFVKGEGGDSDYFRVNVKEYGPLIGLGIRF